MARFNDILLLIVFQILIGSVCPSTTPLTFSNDEDYNYNNYEKQENASVIPEKRLKQQIQIGACGFQRMIPNQIVQVQSSNFGLATYDNNEACTWTFKGENCLLAAKCPCFDVPASFQCFGDYLRISDSILYSQKFCGDVAPQGAYRSVSGLLTIKFRTDFVGYAGRGFLCYVFCTEPGLGDPTFSLVQNPNNCFNSTGEVTIPPVFSSEIPTGEFSITPVFSTIPTDDEFIIPPVVSSSVRSIGGGPSSELPPVGEIPIAGE